jgi:hypothetical protein
MIATFQEISLGGSMVYYSQEESFNGYLKEFRVWNNTRNDN